MSLDRLSPRERERHDASVPAVRDRFVRGRMLLRTLAADLTGDDPLDIDIIATCPDCGGPHGAPQIAGRDLFVSLAHCDLGTIAAASLDHPVGVDVEPVAQDTDRLSAIGLLTGSPELRSWTRVEAVLKADGRGLRVEPGDVRYDSEGAAWVRGSNRRYFIAEHEVDPRILVSLAIAMP